MFNNNWKLTRSKFISLKLIFENNLYIKDNKENSMFCSNSTQHKVLNIDYRGCHHSQKPEKRRRKNPGTQLLAELQTPCNLSCNYVCKIHSRH